jgi:lipid-A-disaccharide synthase
MKILVSALETSSNIHLKELQKHLDKDCELLGIFDKSLGNPRYDITQLAIMGFVDVFKKIPFFLKLKKEMVELAKDVDKILLMDSSGFNLPLAKSIRKKYPEKEIIYYILPQAWVWKKGRVQKLEQTCDKLCSILPFEKEIYTKKEIVSYVGHPLLDEIQCYKKELNNSNIIAFMPGSRKTEITNHMPIFRQLAKKITDKKLVLIIPEKFDETYIKNTYGDLAPFTVSTNAHQTLQDAEFAFICSGTATLEAALIGTPFVLSYIAKSFDYFIGRKIIKMPYIGLANIFFEKMHKPIIHKEYLQEEVTADTLYKEYTQMDRTLFFNNSKLLRDYLQNGSSRNVANIIESN